MPEIEFRLLCHSLYCQKMGRALVSRSFTTDFARLAIANITSNLMVPLASIVGTAVVGFSPAAIAAWYWH